MSHKNVLLCKKYQNEILIKIIVPSFNTAPEILVCFHSYL